MTTEQIRSNPFEAPLTGNYSDGLRAAEVTVDISWVAATFIGIFAGVSSTFCVMCYMDWFGPPGLIEQPYWAHHLRVACFYTAGVLLGGGFVCWGRRSLPSVFGGLAIAGACYLAQFVAEIIVLSVCEIGVLHQSFRALLNVALRSMFIVLVVCWFLKLSVNIRRMAIVVAVGTFAMLLLFPFLGLCLGWSLVAAVQLKLMMPSVKPKQVRRPADLLPNRFRTPG